MNFHQITLQNKKNTVAIVQFPFRGMVLNCLFIDSSIYRNISSEIYLFISCVCVFVCVRVLSYPWTLLHKTCIFFKMHSQFS